MLDLMASWDSHLPNTVRPSRVVGLGLNENELSENKVLSHPASVDSIPTSANKEDHVSMGTIAARKCREIVENTECVIAIEFLCAAQALDLFTNLKPGEGTLAAYRLIREHVSHLENDRIITTDIETVTELMRSGALLDTVAATVGKLH